MIEPTDSSSEYSTLSICLCDGTNINHIIETSKGEKIINYIGYFLSTSKDKWMVLPWAIVRTEDIKRVFVNPQLDK